MYGSAINIGNFVYLVDEEDGREENTYTTRRLSLENDLITDEKIIDTRAISMRPAYSGDYAFARRPHILLTSFDFCVWKLRIEIKKNQLKIYQIALWLNQSFQKPINDGVEVEVQDLLIGFIFTSFFTICAHVTLLSLIPVEKKYDKLLQATELF